MRERGEEGVRVERPAIKVTMGSREPGGGGRLFEQSRDSPGLADGDGPVFFVVFRAPPCAR